MPKADLRPRLMSLGLKRRLCFGSALWRRIVIDAALPYRLKPQNLPAFGGNHILILEEENFFIINNK